MIRPIGSTVGFAVLWVILWRDLSIANVLSGLVVGVVVTTLPRRDEARHRVRPLAVLRFLGVFAVKLVEANIELAREVVTPTNSINTGIVAVPIPVESDAVVTLVASAVSLTPGTLTLETTSCPDPVLYVHKEPLLLRWLLVHFGHEVHHHVRRRSARSSYNCILLSFIACFALIHLHLFRDPLVLTLRVLTTEFSTSCVSVKCLLHSFPTGFSMGLLSHAGSFAPPGNPHSPPCTRTSVACSL